MSFKISKHLMVALMVFLLSSAYVRNVGQENKSTSDLMSNIIDELGLKNAVNVTRDNLKMAWDKLLNKMYPEEYPEHSYTFKSLIDKYTADVPDIIPRFDLGKYFNQEKINGFLQEAKTNYGDKISAYFQSAFDNLKSFYYRVTGTEPQAETLTEKIKRAADNLTPDLSGVAEKLKGEKDPEL